MNKFKFWDGTSSISTPMGGALTKEEIHNQFPFSAHVPTVLGYYLGDETTVGSIDSLFVLTDVHSIDASLSQEEILRQIEHISNNPPPPNDSTIPLTRGDVQLLEQHMTELELAILEAQNG